MLDERLLRRLKHRKSSAWSRAGGTPRSVSSSRSTDSMLTRPVDRPHRCLPLNMFPSFQYAVFSMPAAGHG